MNSNYHLILLIGALPWSVELQVPTPAPAGLAAWLESQGLHLPPEGELLVEVTSPTPPQWE